jgi:hypothetical protein
MVTSLSVRLQSPHIRHLVVRPESVHQRLRGVVAERKDIFCIYKWNISLYKNPHPPPPNPHLLYLYPLPSIADTESGDFLAPGSGQQHWLYLYPAFLSNVQVNG